MKMLGIFHPARANITTKIVKKINVTYWLVLPDSVLKTFAVEQYFSVQTDLVSWIRVTDVCNTLEGMVVQIKA